MTDAAPPNRTLSLVGACAGIFVLGFTLYWTVAPIPTSTPLAGRYANNAVLAMELARTADDVAIVIGRDPPSVDDVAIRARLDRVNQLDFVYMAGYGALLICGFLAVARARRARAYHVGVALVVVALLADGVENWVLLTLTAPGADPEAHLPTLIASTYVKWELLALATALLGWTLLRRRGWGWRVAGAVGLTAAPIGVWLVFAPSTAGPLLTLSFAPPWIALFVDFLQSSRRRGASAAPGDTWRADRESGSAR